MLYTDYTSSHDSLFGKANNPSMGIKRYRILTLNVLHPQDDQLT